MRNFVNGVISAADALRLLLWTDARALGRMRARLGDGLTPDSRRAHLRWLRALGLSTSFIPWVALALAWGSRELVWAQGPLWASKLALFLGLMLAWAYGRGVLQWLRQEAWALAVYRQCGHDPRQLGLRQPRLLGHAPVERRWRAARLWAWAAGLSLIGLTLLMAQLPEAFRSTAVGWLAVAMAWMLAMVEGYTDRVGDVCQLGMR